MKFESEVNFGDKFYSLDITVRPPRIVEWEVEKIIFRESIFDDSGNKVPAKDDQKVLYGLVRFDKSIRTTYRAILGLGIDAFKSKEELMNFLSR